MRGRNRTREKKYWGRGAREKKSWEEGEEMGGGGDNSLFHVHIF